MGTIVVIVAFLLAASANPIDNVSHHYSEESPDTNGYDEPHSSASEVASDVAEGTGEDMGPRDEEQDPSNSDSSIDSPKEDEEQAPTSDTAYGPTGNDTSSNAGDEVSSPDSAVTQISTEQSIVVDTDTRNVTEPPDADPYDCRAPKPLTHVYDACTFLCNGDMMETAPENSTCLLNYTGNFTEQNEPTGLQENVTGVCVQGTCIKKPTNRTETTPQSSTDTTTTTPNISETTPEPSVADTTTSPESSSPGNPTNPSNSVVEMDPSSQSPPSPLDEGHVAMQ